MAAAVAAIEASAVNKIHSQVRFVPESGGGGSTTVTVTCALRPHWVLAVMTAVPGATAATKPVALTTATELLLEVQVILRLVALVGAAVAVSCSV